MFTIRTHYIAGGSGRYFSRPASSCQKEGGCSDGCTFQWILLSEDYHNNNLTANQWFSGETYQCIFPMTLPIRKLSTVCDPILNIINIHVRNVIYVHQKHAMFMRLYQVSVLSICIHNTFCYCMYCECFGILPTEGAWLKIEFDWLTVRYFEIV